MCRVLVVDDEQEVRAAVERRLSRDGLRVDTAAGHDEAVEKIRASDPPYDIVLTDMVMDSPDSGISVLKAALAEDIFTEVVVLTAYGNVANAVECMKNGAFDYVQKNMPGVDVYDLISEKIALAMDRRKTSLGTTRRMEWFARILGK